MSFLTWTHKREGELIPGRQEVRGQTEKTADIRTQSTLCGDLGQRSTLRPYTPYRCTLYFTAIVVGITGFCYHKPKPNKPQTRTTPHSAICLRCETFKSIWKKIFFSVGGLKVTAQKMSQANPKPEVWPSYPLPDLQLSIPYLVSNPRDSQIPIPHSQFY